MSAAKLIPIIFWTPYAITVCAVIASYVVPSPEPADSLQQRFAAADLLHARQ